MSEVPLAHKYSAETYDRALSNLVTRWDHEGSEEPIKYDQAAGEMDKSTTSVALKYLGEIGLLEVPKAGYYEVPDEVFRFRDKIGDVAREAKQEVASRLEEYPLYEETKFHLKLKDSVCEFDDLVEAVAGSTSVAASQDEVRDVERSLNILDVLGFLEIDDEGRVSIPEDLENDPVADEPEDNTSSENDTSLEDYTSPEVDQGPEPEPAEGAAEPTGRTVARQTPDGGAIAVQDGVTGINVEMDISMDVTEMETEEVEQKLEAIHDVFGQNEE
ncbi:hypothetical protein [Haloterrigena salinisoli]|uniref:hypothetical protein n=1 Tax=Haloterrigena salinisoli TaxID=3132747 RepID=UPI0030D5293F